MKNSIFFTIIYAPILFISTVNAQSWEVTEVEKMPKRIANNAVVEGVVNDTSYVFSFAGIDTSKKAAGLTLEAFAYNTVSDKWKTIPSLPDTAGKIACGASHIDNIIYIVGGYYVATNGSELSSAKLHRYDVLNEQYLSDGASIPVPIDDHVQAVWKDSLLFVITGWNNTTNVSNVQIYDPKLNSWMQGTAVPNTDTYKSFGASGAIVGNTIYYFGGASSNGASNFGIQNVLRIGQIDPNDPTQIDWSDTILDNDLNGYRMASTTAFGKLHWIGGSNETYNFDGLAYAGGQGVNPNNRNLVLDPDDFSWHSLTSSGIPYPMDLRGIAVTSDSVRYLAGGMEENQQVSDRTLKLTYRNVPLGLTDLQQPTFSLFPNPTSNSFTILHSLSKNAGLRILNLEGKEIRQQALLSNRMTISTEGIIPGIYLVEIASEKQLVHKRLVILTQ